MIMLTAAFLFGGCGSSDSGGTDGVAVNFQDLAGRWNVTVSMLGIFEPFPTSEVDVEVDSAGLTIRWDGSFSGAVGRLEFLPDGQDLGGALVRGSSSAELSTPTVRRLLQRLSGGAPFNFDGTWVWSDPARPERGACTAVSSEGVVDVTCSGGAVLAGGSGRITKNRMIYDSSAGVQVVATRK